MEFWQRQRLAMILGQVATLVLLSLVFYRPGFPMLRRAAPMLGALVLLALMFGPVGIGTYFGRRKRPKN